MKAVIWTTLVSFFGMQLAVAAPPPVPTTAVSHRHSTFVVDPENYPIENTKEAFTKFFEDVRASKIESIELIYDMNEYYNTKADLENGVSEVDGKKNSMNCQLVHDDTGEPCKEFFSVIYRAPGQEPMNLLSEFTKEKRAAVERENEARKAKGQALKNLPPVKYGMTWWDYTYSLDKVKTDNEKIIMENYGMSSDSLQVWLTGITFAGTLVLAWAVKSDQKLAESNPAQKALNALDRNLSRLSEAIDRVGNKVKKTASSKAGQEILVDDIKIQATQSVIKEIEKLDLGLQKAAEKAPGSERFKLFRTMGGGLNQIRKNIPFISPAAKSWYEFVKNHWVFGSFMHLGLTAEITKWEMRALDLHYKPEVNARMYMHRLVTYAFMDATRKKGAASVVTGTADSTILPSDPVRIAAGQDLAQLTEDQLQEAVKDSIAKEAPKQQDAAQVVTQVAGPEMGKAVAQATPGDNVVNAPEPLKLTPTDKPVSAVRRALLEFLTKYNRKAVRVESN